MPTSYKDLFELNLKYADYIVEKSLLIHQYVHSIHGSGSSVEVEVRALMRSVIPARFKVTHGYIASALNAIDEPTVSPQVDVIIVDTLVPHSLWLMDQVQGAEVVPKESVVGAFEVKRTLSFATLDEGLKHLRNIVAEGRLRKDDATTYFPGGLRPGGGLIGGLVSNPILGIIGLAADDSVTADGGAAAQAALARVAADGQGGVDLDFVLSLSGIFAATGEPVTNNYRPVLTRVPDEDYGHWVCTSPAHGNPRHLALARSLGFILFYLGSVSGARPDVNSYFFNQSLA